MYRQSELFVKLHGLTRDAIRYSRSKRSRKFTSDQTALQPPNFFDRLLFITRGGTSKSSKGINLSEDIFAGDNNVICSGYVSFKEYLQVGKGRDVGMSQVYKSEA